MYFDVKIKNAIASHCNLCLLQWPGLKRVGVRVAETIWDRDHVVERGDAWLCNLRECVFSLLR